MIEIGFSKPDSAIGRLIANHDLPALYCHAYLIFGGFVADAGNKFGINETMICEAHSDDGVRFKQRDFGDDLRIPLHSIDLAEEELIRRFCELEAGCGYDFGGIAAIAGVPLCKPDPDRWFCSELVAAALQSVGLLPGLVSYQTTPNGLYLALNQ